MPRSYSYHEVAQDSAQSLTENIKNRSSQDDHLPIIETTPTSSTQCYRTKQHLLWLAVSILFVVVVVYGSLQLYSSRAQPIAITDAHCGRTAAEAKALGCIYEPMQRSWIPEACYFSEPGNEYTPFDDRPWYYDSNLTQKIEGKDLDRLRNGDDLMAYTQSFHHEHCLYCYRKLAIAVEKRLPYIDSKTASFHHSTHCAKMISAMIYDVANSQSTYLLSHTISPLMFQTCVRLTWSS